MTTLLILLSVGHTLINLALRAMSLKQPCRKCRHNIVICKLRVCNMSASDCVDVMLLVITTTCSNVSTTT